MVSGSLTYVITRYENAPPKLKFSSEVTNEFVINEIFFEQAYFWTKGWQDGEKEADKDIERGRVNRFKSAKDTIQYLHSKRK